MYELTVGSKQKKRVVEIISFANYRRWLDIEQLTSGFLSNYSTLKNRLGGYFTYT